MSAEVLVRVEGVSKRFCRSLRRSLWYGVRDIAADLNPFSSPAPGAALRRDEFWALRDVSFELRRGECLGLIGRNGAGKTTLLKLLNGLIKPDAGRIEIRGRIGALIALGAGFNPVLTGRENIYVNGSILGLSRSDIAGRLDAIIDFAEVRDFIDTPVQNYSSGMQVRLGFAVAAHLIRPDVLILDEVLAVGDEAFRAKCYEAVSGMLRRCAVIFVSHSMPMIQRISTRVMVLSAGQTLFTGAPANGIRAYMHTLEGTAGVERRSLGTGEATIHRLAIVDGSGATPPEHRQGGAFGIRLDLTVSDAYPEYEVSVTFMSRNQELAAQCHSRASGYRCRHGGGRHRLEIGFDALPLGPGRYWVNVVVLDPRLTRHLCWEFAAATFDVAGDFVGSTPVLIAGRWHTAPLPDGEAAAVAGQR